MRRVIAVAAGAGGHAGAEVPGPAAGNPGEFSEGGPDPGRRHFRKTAPRIPGRRNRRGRLGLMGTRLIATPGIPGPARLQGNAGGRHPPGYRLLAAVSGTNANFMRQTWSGPATRPSLAGSGKPNHDSAAMRPRPSARCVERRPRCSRNSRRAHGSPADRQSAWPGNLAACDQPPSAALARKEVSARRPGCPALQSRRRVARPRKMKSRPIGDRGDRRPRRPSRVPADFCMAMGTATPDGGCQQQN